MIFAGGLETDGDRALAEMPATGGVVFLARAGDVHRDSRDDDEGLDAVGVLGSDGDDASSVVMLSGCPRRAELFKERK